MEQVGKSKRIKRIFSHSSGKLLVVPLDDSLLAGPINGLENIRSKTKNIISASPNAIIGFQGLLRNHSDIIGNTPTILNLTASTTRVLHTRKSLVGSIELAIQLGVEAVAVHFNLSSIYENEMMRYFGEISMECNKYGMPLMGIMYPRKENDDNSDNNYLNLKETDKKKYAELVAHASRVGVELGADIIKTQYTGDIDTFRYVVGACQPIPVIIAGGPANNINELLNIAKDAMDAGGGGISFGRNIFSRENPIPYILALKEIIHNNSSVDKALNVFNSALNND